MMHLLFLLASASAQTDDSPDPVTLLREMAPYRAQLHATLRDGTWKTAPSQHIDGGLCLEEVLVPTPGRPHDGSTLAVAEGIALADYIVDQSPYTPRYMRTHYKELGNTLVMWEGSERQYTQRTLGEFWHDAVWAGRDTLFIRDEDGRVQTLYMEATRHSDSCVCEVSGHANLCPGFGHLDSRDASMIEKDAFYTLIQLVWEGDVVTAAHISQVSEPNSGELRYHTIDPGGPMAARVRTVSFPAPTPSSETCSSPKESPLQYITLDWHAAEAMYR